MNSWVQRISLLIFLTFLTFNDALTQCAMCKATIEGNEEVGELEYGYNINIGILFLMIIPYIILFIAFRKKIFKLLRDLKNANG